MAGDPLRCDACVRPSFGFEGTDCDATVRRLEYLGRLPIAVDRPLTIQKSTVISGTPERSPLRAKAKMPH